MLAAAEVVEYVSLYRCWRSKHLSFSRYGCQIDDDDKLVAAAAARSAASTVSQLNYDRS